MPNSLFAEQLVLLKATQNHSKDFDIKTKRSSPVSESQQATLPTPTECTLDNTHNSKHTHKHTYGWVWCQSPGSRSVPPLANSGADSTSLILNSLQMSECMQLTTPLASSVNTQRSTSVCVCVCVFLLFGPCARPVLNNPYLQPGY